MTDDEMVLSDIIAATLAQHRTKVHGSNDNFDVRCESSCGYTSSWWNAKAAWDDVRFHQAAQIAEALFKRARCPERNTSGLQCQMLSSIPHDWHTAKLVDASILSWR